MKLLYRFSELYNPNLLPVLQKLKLQAVWAVVLKAAEIKK